MTVEGIARMMTLKQTSIHLPDEMWIQIYSYVGKHPIVSILKPRMDLLNEHRWIITNMMGNSQISNRSLMNLADFNDMNLGCGGFNGVESYLRDYMKYFYEFNEANFRSKNKNSYFWQKFKNKYCSEKVICICGSSIMGKYFKKHVKSQKHRTYLLSA
jgi:hypothetical protein